MQDHSISSSKRRKVTPYDSLLSSFKITLSSDISRQQQQLQQTTKTILEKSVTGIIYSIVISFF